MSAKTQKVNVPNGSDEIRMVDAKYARNFRNKDWDILPSWAKALLDEHPQFKQVDMTKPDSGPRYWTGQSWDYTPGGDRTPTVITIFTNLTTELYACVLTRDGLYVPTLIS